MNPLNLRPLHDRVLLRKIKPLVHESLLELPPSAIDAANPEWLCEVLAVGPGRYLYRKNGEVLFEPTVLKAGEKVIVGRYNDFEWKREKVLICAEGDVRAVVEEAIA